MNKITEKKAYIKPQMSVLKMETNVPILHMSYYEERKSSPNKSRIVNDNYNIVDFD